jgi:exodeoxyribonuclease (lambda-induced)
MAESMAYLKNGDPSAARVKLLMEVVAERLTDQIVPHYVSPEMVWGREQEGAAKNAYTLRTGRRVEPCFFFDHFEIENFGASPDGLVEGGGLLETKCPKTSTHIGWLTSGVVPNEHKPQMLAQMACTGRKWCDFASFDPRIPNENSLFVVRFEPRQEDIQAVEAEAMKFLAEAGSLFERMTATAL